MIHSIQRMIYAKAAMAIVAYTFGCGICLLLNIKFRKNQKQYEDLVLSQSVRVVSTSIITDSDRSSNIKIKQDKVADHDI